MTAPWCKRIFSCWAPLPRVSILSFKWYQILFVGPFSLESSFICWHLFFPWVEDRLLTVNSLLWGRFELNVLKYLLYFNIIYLILRLSFIRLERNHQRIDGALRLHAPRHDRRSLRLATGAQLAAETRPVFSEAQTYYRLVAEFKVFFSSVEKKSVKCSF